MAVGTDECQRSALRPLLEFREADLASRNAIGAALFRAWWNPFASVGVIHGDPHLGNYTIFETDGMPAGINLLDYGCIRTFATKFVQGVVDRVLLYVP